MNRHFEKYIRLFSHTWLSLTMACLVFSFFVTGCGSDDDDTPPNDPSIIGEIQSKPSLSTLFTALEKYPDLTSTLTSPGTFTVFAPTNQAFDDFLTKIGQTDVNEISEDVLKNVLQYHMVVTATLSTGQLVNGNLKSANNEDIAVAVSADVKLNGVVNIVMPNIEATNGVVHIIDAVLIPPSVLPVFSTIVAIPYFDRDFTTLMAAINAADPTILTTLLGNGPSGKKLTIFAPTNDAFVAAGITTLPDQASLNAMLKYHVIDDEILTDELPTGSTTIPTLDGNLYVTWLSRAPAVPRQTFWQRSPTRPPISRYLHQRMLRSNSCTQP